METTLIIGNHKKHYPTVFKATELSLNKCNPNDCITPISNLIILTFQIPASNH
jgi:hypothetical protein